MPSVASLEKHEYYGKPQNAFWRIMGDLIGASPDLAYRRRTEILTRAGIAVWDVLASCVRPGSLDSSIDMQSAEVNDIAGLIALNAGITAVFFNGKKSEQIFRKNVLTQVATIRPDMRYISLPSTSPAMATLDFSAKLQSWRVVKDALR